MIAYSIRQKSTGLFLGRFLPSTGTRAWCKAPALWTHRRNALQVIRAMRSGTEKDVEIVEYLLEEIATSGNA